ncbi:MAG: hypothetical protein P8H65_09965 [Rhodothermales bacterium]|nr:hypothetical protein [Rhodothermales bacterium]MDG2016050.1 hypothetical protein [Rhodothermales bacterium]HAY36655.1 hypothetical protein [Bacteroidota bacterium]
MKVAGFILLFVILLSGCSPKLSPLYRDYEVTADASHSQADVLDRIERGLLEAGWNPIAGPTGNVIATEMRRFRQWGLYSVEVELEVAPVGGEYVRLLVHPFRIYFTGAKSKVPYLRGSLARAVLKDLHATFETEGLSFIGTAQSRNKAAQPAR